MLGADVAPAGNSGRTPDMIGLRPHGLSKADRGLDNVAATGTAMAAAPRLGALVRRASAHVANKPHHRTISTAAPERRSRGAITRLDGMGVFEHVRSVSKHFWMDRDAGKGARPSRWGRAPIAPRVVR